MPCRVPRRARLLSARARRTRPPDARVATAPIVFFFSANLRFRSSAQSLGSDPDAVATAPSPSTRRAGTPARAPRGPRATRGDARSGTRSARGRRSGTRGRRATPLERAPPSSASTAVEGSTRDRSRRRHLRRVPTRAGRGIGAHPRDYRGAPDREAASKRRGCPRGARTARGGVRAKLSQRGEEVSLSGGGARARRLNFQCGRSLRLQFFVVR